MNTLDQIAARLLELPEEERRAIAQEAFTATKEFEHWVPNPGPQTLAYYSEADELFYGGEAGGGKTDLLLGTAINAHQRSLILRRLNGEVHGLIERMQAILGHTKGLKKSSPAHWRLKNRLVKFGGCQHPNDWVKYQGDPKDFIGFDELTAFLESQYRAIIAWNRSVNAGQRVRIIGAGNPPMTVEGQWVIKYWGAWLDPNHPNPAVPGELRYYTTVDDMDVEVDGPGPVMIDGVPLLDKNGKPIHPRSRTFIPAELADNPDLEETGYGDRLAALPGPMRAALKEGDFGASMKDDQWQVFPAAWIQAAMDRWHPDGKLTRKMEALGVDVAQGGDDNTVLAPRYGKNWFDRLHVFPGKETPDGPTVGALVLLHRRDGAEIVVDMGGGWGGSTIDHLKGNKVPVTGFQPSASGAGRDRTGSLKFANARARAYWMLRDALDPEYGSHLALPPDAELKADLAAIRWKPAVQGVQILEKEEIKKLLGRSPDRADAVVYAFDASGLTHIDGSGNSTLPRQANLSSRAHPYRRMRP